MTGVVLDKVVRRYRDTVAVESLDLEIRDKEFVVLLGPSGCGKTTTLNMIAGMDSPSSGHILFDNKPMETVPPEKRNIAMVFQSIALYPHKTVYENIAFPLRMSGTPKAQIDARVRAAAGLMRIGELLNRKPHELSGGQRQRVALGRAAVRDPVAFLFDEPLSALDAKLRTEMRVEIKKLHERLNSTFIYVTHDQVEAMTMADKIVVMQDGRIEQIGTPLELYDRPANLFVAQFIGSPSMNVVTGTLRRQADAAWVEVEGGTRWPLPASAPGADGQAVVYGVRPGDLALGGGERSVPAEVIVVEPTGAETELLVQAGAAQIVVVMHGRTDVQPGQAISLTVALDSVHLFDPAGGATMRA
ncbi:MAG: ABC transporter ATP-binding protein [Burkholderiales bacterium]|nr:ABC transporter ATP-binding protein [Burkholderiales bacterium]